MKIHFFNPAVHVICMTLHTDVCVCVNVSPDGAKSIYHLAIRVSHDNIKEVNMLLYIYNSNFTSSGRLCTKVWNLDEGN